MNGTFLRQIFVHTINLWNLVKIGAQVVFLVLVIVRERVRRENGRETKDVTTRGGVRDRAEGMKGNTRSDGPARRVQRAGHKPQTL